jgi:hypothetical protein
MGGATAGAVLAQAAAAPARPANAAQMWQRSYRGEVLYLTDDVEMGREFFSVTIQPDGTRTLRAQCEMDDFRLLRDVVLTVDKGWRPLDAFVRLSVAGQLVGSSWFRFDAQDAESQGFTSVEGRVTQHFHVPEGIQALATHAVHGDSWVVGRLGQFQGKPDDMPLATFATSVLSNGGSGPVLIPLKAGFSHISDLGANKTTVRAGTFDTHHIRIVVPSDDFEVWASGEDCVPVKLVSHGLKQTYELVKLDGDWR